MINNIDKNCKEITIIGCGISGLMLGFFAKKAGLSVKIFEKSSVAGGLVGTRRNLYGNMESAAHLFREKAEIMELCRDIGVDLLEIKTTKKLLIKSNKIVKFPFKIGELFNFLHNLFSKKQICESDNLADAAQHYFGSPGLQYFVSPFVHGVYGCAPHDLSAKVFFSGFEKNMRPISFLNRKKSRNKIYAPRHGMQEIVDKLASFLQNEIVYNAPIYNLEYISGYKNIVIATDAQTATKFFEEQNPNISSILSRIQYTNITIIWAFFDAKKIENLNAIGALSVGNVQDGGLLGMLFNSASFDNRATSGIVSITALFRTQNPWEVTALMQKLSAVLGESPLFYHAKFVRDAIPLYSSDLFEIKKELEIKAVNVSIFGNYLGKLAIGELAESAREFFN